MRDDNPGTRDYYLAGTEHLGGGTLGFAAPGPPRNHLSLAPLNRAVLELARRWVVDGHVPPATRRPRVDDGTAIQRSRALRKFGAVTGLALPDEETMLQRQGSPTDTTDDRPPPSGVYVSALDDDGNEVAGIRHPELSVPLATHTFPPAETEATSEGDHRRAVSARYRDRDDYLVQLKAAALQLAREGFLLTEDIDRVVATASARYDLFARTVPISPETPVPQVKKEGSLS
jgi:hypothetical protein